MCFCTYVSMYLRYSSIRPPPSSVYFRAPTRILSRTCVLVCVCVYLPLLLLSPIRNKQIRHVVRR
ncbi:hypothetical protein AHF37_05792 [Paragonimus kellicotti]|nr:hypothetical protein AHF37_05792 [Paragonimus kellicotti]